MINFIVCDDKRDFGKYVKKVITNFMMNYEEDYQLYYFSGYNDSFHELVKKDIGFRVYILDIMTDEGSGIDAAREIREKYDDWSSIIIIVTSHEEYRFEALSNRLYLMDFINKLSNCENNIIDALTRVMKSYNCRHKSLGFEYNHTYHKIDFKDIICIEKEQDSKRCLIKTIYGESVIPGTLNDVLKKLDERFLKVHRSLIINIDNLESYDSKKNLLTFKNGTTSYLVSRDKKKELINRVKNLK